MVFRVQITSTRRGPDTTVAVQVSSRLT